jgi:HSP90 family molecular chaperone
MLCSNTAHIPCLNFICRGRLAKLLRFHTSKSPKELTSLAGYISRVKSGQKTIYWIAGMSQDEVARSPFAEKLVAEVCALCRTITTILYFHAFLGDQQVTLQTI